MVRQNDVRKNKIRCAVSIVNNAHQPVANRISKDKVNVTGGLMKWEW
jgi:hypothetical protein